MGGGFHFPSGDGWSRQGILTPAVALLTTDRTCAAVDVCDSELRKVVPVGYELVVFPSSPIPDHVYPGAPIASAWSAWGTPSALIGASFHTLFRKAARCVG